MTLQLRPMTVEEFAAFRIYEIDDHAGDLSLRDQISIEDAQELAQSQFEALLPQGANTDGHEFHTVLEDEHSVGKLWIREERRSDKDRRVVVWKIEIDEPFRGRGLGRELMKLVERLALEKEARAIELYVFGHNARARALYESLGYQVLGTQMRKELHPLEGELKRRND